MAMRQHGRLWQAVHSLRGQLTLTYIGLLTLLLIAAGIFQYAALRQSLIDARVSQFRNDVNDARDIAVRNPTTSSFPQSDPLAGKNVCADTIVTNPAPALFSYTARISVASGYATSVVLYTTRGVAVACAGQTAFPNIPLSDSSTVTQVAQSGREGQAHVVSGPAGDMLVDVLPAVGRTGPQRGVLEMATSMQPIDSVLVGEQHVLIFGGLLVVVIALTIGVLLTKRALQPLHRLTLTAQQLARGNLRARSGLEPRHDEVGMLAHSIDDMAQRIEGAFAAKAASEEQARRFIADASHELRTPITALKGYIDVIRRGAVTDPGALDAALTAMSGDADRMRVLVSDLLTLARVDANRPLQPVEFDVNVVLARILDEGVPGMPESVQREFAVDGVAVIADQSAVITIIRNLLVNACKYAPGAAQVWSTTRNDARGCFSVRDAGPGIPADDLPHIFERFYRGAKMRAREEGGSGLGLSIVQSLARAQGGDVTVRSVEGQGATFTVLLPLAH